MSVLYSYNYESDSEKNKQETCPDLIETNKPTNYLSGSYDHTVSHKYAQIVYFN